MDASGIQILFSIGTGAIATFCAIMLWPRTRDIAWMLIVIGTIFHYGSVVFQALEIFGVTRIALEDELAVGIVRGLLVNAPFVFYTISFLVMIRRKTFA